MCSEIFHYPFIIKDVGDRTYVPSDKTLIKKGQGNL